MCVCVCVSVCVVVNYGNKSISMKKIENQSIPNGMNLFMIAKSTL